MQKLEKSYREWLERDVPYIITKDEKDAFLRLTTDEARDKFIEDFWEIRNPNPGSQHLLGGRSQAPLSYHPSMD